MEEIVLQSMQRGTKQDHYHSVLTRMVTAVSQDHNQLRTLIYEFARRKLRKDLFRQFEDGDWSEIERQISTLEAAINQVETGFTGIAPPAEPTPALTFAGNGDTTPTPPALNPISQKDLLAGDYSGRAFPEFLTARASDVAPQPAIITVTEYKDGTTNPSLNKFLASNFWRTVQLVVAVVLGLGIYSLINDQTALYVLTFHRFGSPANTSPPVVSAPQESAAKPEPKPRSGVTDLPLPNSYGVYALVNGQLTSLDTLPIRIPDPRVAVSAMISSPSRAHVPAGPIQFILYRRDLANDAPDRVSLRVVAQIMRALTFSSSGKPSYADVDQSWVVRGGSSYQMSVAPVADSPEMIILRPDPPDLILPAGRYALALKSGAFDFTVDGPISDPAHCLERTDTLGASVYSECPKH